MFLQKFQGWASEMTDTDRIAELERLVADLRRRVGCLEAEQHRDSPAGGASLRCICKFGEYVEDAGQSIVVDPCCPVHGTGAK